MFIQSPAQVKRRRSAAPGPCGSGAE